jgi:hypothetical protein
MYDYYLGGKDHWQADRQAAEQILAVAPKVRAIARANRAFLRRAVTYLAKEKGVTQFLDIGTGIPTSPNVHETAAGLRRGNPRRLRRQRPGDPRPRQRPAHRHRDH